MARIAPRTRRSNGYCMRLRITVVQGVEQPRSNILKLMMAAQDRGRGWSVRQLAGAAGVSRALVGHLVSGKRDTVRPLYAQRIAQALGVDPYVLWEEKPTRRDTREK